MVNKLSPPGMIGQIKASMGLMQHKHNISAPLLLLS